MIAINVRRLALYMVLSFAVVSGGLTLSFVADAGADVQLVNSGTGVFGGMLAATFLAIFFVPLFFVVIRKLRRPGAGSGPRDGAGKERARQPVGQRQESTRRDLSRTTSRL